MKVFIVPSVIVLAMAVLAGCTDNQGVNAATGGLAGAAVGSQLGEGKGRVAATLAGAAVGTAIGGSQPTTRLCTYLRPSTGETYKAPCPN